jgi:hypothetical protein
MSYRAFAVWAMSILTLPLCSLGGWDGHPWAGNTNAPNWYALEDTYDPVGQIYTGICERVALIKATSFLPPVQGGMPLDDLSIIETHVVDYGTSSSVVTAVVVAAGFPLLGSLGDALNLDGIYGWNGVSGRYENGQGDFIAYDEFYNYGGWAIVDDGDWDWFVSDNLVSADWSDRWEVLTCTGAVSLLSVATNVSLLTTNVTTTNQMSQFIATVDGHSVTGTPYLSRYCLAAMDSKIDELMSYFVNTNVIAMASYTNYPDKTSTWKPPAITRKEIWAQAQIGGVTACTNSPYYYTRQPPMTNVWLLGEWEWTGSNWLRNVTSTYDHRHLGALLPVIEYHSVTTGVVSIAVGLEGTSRIWNTSTNAYYTNTLTAVGATSLSAPWYRITDSTITGDALSTGDYVTVRYEGPIVLYGDRPYRLYAQDLDERARVLSQLVATHARVKPQKSYEWKFSNTVSRAYGSASATNYPFGSWEEWESLMGDATSALAYGASAEILFGDPETGPYALWSLAHQWYDDGIGDWTNGSKATCWVGQKDATRTVYVPPLCPSKADVQVVMCGHKRVEGGPDLVKDFTPIYYGDGWVSTNMWAVTNNLVGYNIANDSLSLTAGATNTLAFTVGPVEPGPLPIAPNSGGWPYSGYEDTSYTYGWEGVWAVGILRWDISGGLKYK